MNSAAHLVEGLQRLYHSGPVIQSCNFVSSVWKPDARWSCQRRFHWLKGRESAAHAVRSNRRAVHATAEPGDA